MEGPLSSSSSLSSPSPVASPGTAADGFREEEDGNWRLYKVVDKKWLRKEGRRYEWQYHLILDRQGEKREEWVWEEAGRAIAKELWQGEGEAGEGEGPPTRAVLGATAEAQFDRLVEKYEIKEERRAKQAEELDKQGVLWELESLLDRRYFPQDLWHTIGWALHQLKNQKHKERGREGRNEL